MNFQSCKLLCEEFFSEMYVNTQLELPTARDTILTFFERLQRQFPDMAAFSSRDGDDPCLESDRTKGFYRWVSLEKDRIASGLANPEDHEQARAQHLLILELMPYMLSVSHLDVHSIDVNFVMEFERSPYADDVVAEALLGNSAFACLFESPQAKPLGLAPNVIIGLSEDNHTQVRLTVESKTISSPNFGQDRTTEQPITMSLAVRQYAPAAGKIDPVAEFHKLFSLANDLMEDKIIPNFARPLSQLITEKKMG